MEENTQVSDGGITPDTGGQAAEQTTDYSGSVSRIEAQLNGTEPVHGNEPTFDGGKPADGGSDGAEVATQEDGEVTPEEDDSHLSPQERALNKLKELDPDGYEAIMAENERRDAALRAEEERRTNEEIQARIQKGEWLAASDPAIAQAWSEKAFPQYIAPVLQEALGTAPAMAEGIVNDFAGSIAQTVAQAIEASERIFTAEEVGQLISAVASQLQPHLAKGIEQDIRGINQKFIKASIDTANTAHSATVETNKSRAYQNELHNAFHEKAGEAESVLGRKLSQEERARHLGWFGMFLKADPKMSPEAALEKSFEVLLHGVNAGKTQGRREAVQKNTRLGHENAHRGGAKPSQRQTMAQQVESGMDIDQILRQVSA